MFFIKKILVLIIASIFSIFLINNNEYLEIPSTSIRMRVISNSNSKKDIQNKELIRKKFEEVIYKITKDKDNLEEIDKIVINNKNFIDKEIKDYMQKINISEKYSSNYGLNYFPEKDYKNIRYKAGNYKSFVIKLGEGNGDNWWCVLYPPICLIDESKNNYEIKFLIKELIDKYN